MAGTIFSFSFWHQGLAHRVPTKNGHRLRTLRDAAVFIHTHFAKQENEKAVKDTLAALAAAARSGSNEEAGSLTPEDRGYVRQYLTTREVDDVFVEERVIVGQPLPRTVRHTASKGIPDWRRTATRA
jgi:hypothetical protein